MKHFHIFLQNSFLRRAVSIFVVAAAISFQLPPLFAYETTTAVDTSEGVSQSYVRERLRRNPELSLGNMLPYRELGEGPEQAPEGYNLCYVSHVGRHGSRYFNMSSPRHRMMAFISEYSSFLKPKGRKLMRDLDKVQVCSDKHPGELSALGEKELFAMGRRMGERTANLLGGSRVVTYSTNSGRVMRTRDCFVAGLLDRVPSVEVDTVEFRSKGKVFKEVRGYEMSNEQQEFTNKVGSRYAETLWREYDPKPFLDRYLYRERRGSVCPLFADDGLGRRYVYCVFECASAFLSSGEPLPDMLRYFSEEDLYQLWANRSNQWVGRCGIARQNGAVRPLTLGRGIAEEIIDDADAALTVTPACSASACSASACSACPASAATQASSASASPAATLRFTHDSYIVPLLAYLDIEGCSFDRDTDTYSQFLDFDIVTMGVNLQLFFYRNAAGKVLVQILLNEKPVRLRSLSPETASFYAWQDLRAFWLARKDELTRRVTPVL